MESSALPMLETDVRRASSQVLSEKAPSLDTEARRHQRRVERLSNVFEVPDDVTPFPLRSDNQKHVLFNLCHRNQRPKAKYPGFRLLGGFPTLNAAATFANEHYPPGTDSVFATTFHQLLPICNSDAHQGDEVYCRELVTELIDLHTHEAKQRHAEFEHNLDGQSTGKAGDALETRRRAAKVERDQNAHLRELDAQFDEVSARSPASHLTISGSSTVANQRYAVIVYLPDIRPRAMKGASDLQPLIAVLFMADTEKECAIYAKYTASPAYKDCAIDVVSMYSWCFPENVDPDDLPSEVYGNDKLNTIMNARKQNNQRIEEYEQLMETNPAAKEKMVVELASGDLPNPELVSVDDSPSTPE